MSDLLRKAFRLGFEASGEGYNGEYPFEGYNVDEDEEWCEMRDEALAPLAAPVAAPSRDDVVLECLAAVPEVSDEDSPHEAVLRYQIAIRSLISGDTSNG